MTLIRRAERPFGVTFFVTFQPKSVQECRRLTWSQDRYRPVSGRSRWRSGCIIGVRMARPSQLGMTLIELMIVVAIIGILASIAVYMFSRTQAKARASEVPAVFAEFRIRQESFHLENGRYLSTGVDDTDLYPDTGPAVPKDGAIAIDLSAPAAAGWAALRFSSEKSALYCSYVTQAGVPGPTPPATVPGATANIFGFDNTTTPATNWFYMIGECNLDGDSSLDSTYFARSGADGQAVINNGK